VLRNPEVRSNRVDIGDRELTPSQVGDVFANSLLKEPLNHVIVALNDDLTHSPLPLSPEIDMA
jgi:hypothetical protein